MLRNESPVSPATTNPRPPVVTAGGAPPTEIYELFNSSTKAQADDSRLPVNVCRLEPDDAVDAVEVEVAAAAVATLAAEDAMAAVVAAAAATDVAAEPAMVRGLP